MVYLRPFFATRNPDTRLKAFAVEAIMMRERNAFDWAEGKARQQADETFREVLPRMLETLAHGPSGERLLMLGLMEQEDILAILDEAALPSFVRCADDASPAVRRLVARLVGQRWIRNLAEPDPEAIALVMTLSQDADYGVRFDAVYFGLSTLPHKDEQVIRRLLELSFDDQTSALYERIAWGLRTQRDFTRAVLNTYLDGADREHAAAARAVYEDMAGTGVPQ